MKRTTWALLLPLTLASCRSSASVAPPPLLPESEAPVANPEGPTASSERPGLPCASTNPEGSPWGCKVVGNMVCCRFPPPVNGHVLEISTDGLHVTLDVGSEAGVEVGYPFTVYRGSVYCGEVRVERVLKQLSQAHIKSRKGPIAVGDSATTRL